MRYLALVTDYDGVVAREGRPSRAAVAAIERLRASGRRVILNTGRRLPDLLESCPDLGLFDYVVGVGRWILRVQAYAFLLVTDVYPPFRLD